MKKYLSVCWFVVLIGCINCDQRLVFAQITQGKMFLTLRKTMATMLFFIMSWLS